MSKNIPAYCLHKASGQAYVKLDGKRCYLGKHGSPESHRKYAELISGWQQEQTSAPKDITIGQMTVLFVKHAERHYVKHGTETTEVGLIRYAMRYLNRVARMVQLDQFSPRHLKKARELMIESGMTRGSVNKFTQRIRRAVKWAVAEELCSPSVLIGLQAVPDLKKGRCGVRDNPAVKPVPDATINAIREHVSPAVWAMIELQRYSGMRPGEVLIMRGCDLVTSGEVWEYRPESHKTEHHGKERLICIGKNGQAILREWLRPELDRYLFSPSGDGLKSYRRDSYTNAIKRGCEVAFKMPEELRYVARTVDKMVGDTEEERLQERQRLSREAAKWRDENCWSPNQLRHSFATRARREFGLEAARVTLGHSSAAVSEIYAERDQEAARAVVARIG